MLTMTKIPAAVVATWHKPPATPAPDPLTEARHASDAMFRWFLHGECSAEDLAAALRAEYRLAGWRR